MWSLFKGFLKWIGMSILPLVVLLLAPVGYVEAFCRADPDQEAYRPIIKDQKFQRAEANSYLTYPEWHIVYAYEGLAKILESDDEHAFDYLSSISGFWTSFCDLNREAGRHGGADVATRQTVHVIGVSFTMELAMKALYEETIGRLFVVLRGDSKTPQDVYAAAMAADYAGFLQQVPWYKYDFDKSVDELWAQPLSSTLRGWERRLALGGEWRAKSGYARVIAGAVAAAGEAQLRIRSVVRNISPSDIAAIPDVTVVESTEGYTIIETPRYRKFTLILQKIAELGGEIVEIAGNDDIMVSAIEPLNTKLNALQTGSVISRLARDGYASNRILVGVKVLRLSALLAELKSSQRAIEHIYDY